MHISAEETHVNVAQRCVILLVRIRIYTCKNCSEMLWQAFEMRVYFETENFQDM